MRNKLDLPKGESVKLAVVSRYRCRSVEYPAGVEIEVSEAEALSLLSDAPECFKPIKQKGIDKPPVDRQIDEADIVTK